MKQSCQVKGHINHYLKSASGLAAYLWKLLFLNVSFATKIAASGLEAQRKALLYVAFGLVMSAAVVV